MRTNGVKDMYAGKNVLKKLGIFVRSVKSYILKFLEGGENFLAVSLRKG